MRKSSPVLHWFFTLVTAPFVGKLCAFVFDSPSAAFIGTLEVYHITLIGSLILSLPTFLVYLIFFYRMQNSAMSDTAKKMILISIVILGISVTLEVVGGRLKYPLILIYSSTALIIGLLLDRGIFSKPQREPYKN